MIINPYLVQPSGPSYGTLTTAWIAATGETDLTILGALNTLESDMATYGLTAKMKALYPFVGGTAGKHSYNFMNTAAYQITWNGGITHTSNGVQGNATNGYGDTGLNDNSVLSLNDAHISIYSRTNKDAIMCDIGFRDAGVSSAGRIFSKYSGNFYASMHNDDSAIVNAGTSQGLFLSNRVGSTETRNFQNSTLKLVTVNSITKNSQNIYICCNNSGFAQFHSDRQLAIASIGDGLTDTQAGNFYTAVQAFQTALSRNV